MTHLRRAAAILAFGLLAFTVARAVAGAVHFPLLGFDRSDDVASWVGRRVENVGSGACAECHHGQSEAVRGSAHLAVPCEDCHGAGAEHVETRAALGEAGDLCPVCHARLPSRPATFPQVDPRKHGGGDGDCSSCHDPHTPALGIPVIPHRIEGREDCPACHGSTGLRPAPRNHEGRASQSCLGCHEGTEGEEQGA